MSKPVREVTDNVISAVEDGFLSWESVAKAALRYMSEDDVADMAQANDWALFADEDEKVCPECGEDLGEDGRCYNPDCDEYDPLSQYFDDDEEKTIKEQKLTINVEYVIDIFADGAHYYTEDFDKRKRRMPSEKHNPSTPYIKKATKYSSLKEAKSYVEDALEAMLDYQNFYASQDVDTTFDGYIVDEAWKPVDTLLAEGLVRIITVIRDKEVTEKEIQKLKELVESKKLKEAYDGARTWRDEEDEEDNLCPECGKELGEDGRCYNAYCDDYDPLSQYFDDEDRNEDRKLKNNNLSQKELFKKAYKWYWESTTLDGIDENNYNALFDHMKEKFAPLSDANIEAILNDEQKPVEESLDAAADAKARDASTDEEEDFGGKFEAMGEVTMAEARSPKALVEAVIIEAEPNIEFFVSAKVRAAGFLKEASGAKFLKFLKNPDEQEFYFKQQIRVLWKARPDDEDGGDEEDYLWVTFVKDNKAEDAAGEDFFGAAEGTEKADDILFALQAITGNPKLTYKKARELYKDRDAERALAYVKTNGLNKHTYFEEDE